MRAHFILGPWKKRDAVGKRMMAKDEDDDRPEGVVLQFFLFLLLISILFSFLLMDVSAISSLSSFSLLSLLRESIKKPHF